MQHIHEREREGERETEGGGMMMDDTEVFLRVVVVCEVVELVVDIGVVSCLVVVKQKMIYTYDDSILGKMSFFPYTGKFN